MHQHVPHAVAVLEPLIHRDGYAALAGLLLLESIGLPLPGETVLLVAAFYAGIGQLNVWLVVGIAVLAAIIGDNVGYALGRYGGHPLVLRFGRPIGLTPSRLDSLQRFVSKQGPKIILFARFIEGLRQLNGIIAGLSNMSWSKFLVYNSIGATLWVSCWVFVAYTGASHINLLLQFQAYLTAGVVIAAMAWVALRVYQHRRSRH